MKSASQRYLAKAQRALNAARLLCESADHDAAANRVYYAMFYVASAALHERGLHHRKHGAVHAAFGLEFAKSAVLDPKFHRWLLDAFQSRQLADYDIEVALSDADVRELTGRAHEFLAAVTDYLAARDERDGIFP